MLNWPSTLPQAFTTESYQSGVGDGRIQSGTDSGIPKTRRRFSAVIRPVSGSMYMTSSQLDDFITFFESTTGGGSLPFTFPNQEGSGDWIVKFGQNVPSWSCKGVGWMVKIELVILP